jgi:hypothetical protein
MPRPGPRRVSAQTKLTPTGLEAVKQRALDEGLTIRNGEPNVSEMLRIFAAYAQQHMPKGWRP